MNLQLLAQMNTELVAASAAEWTALAGGIAGAGDQLVRGRQEVEDAWRSGTAAEAARQRATVLVTEVSAAEPPCRQIGVALQQHADTARALQVSLQQIVAAATGQGLIVNLAAGTVFAPAAVVSVFGAAAGAQLVAVYTAQLQALLAQAVALDARTAGVLGANQPR
ncbi:hypothetical protein AB0J83_35810 [Actinoplanes sp. NPDC049596]|uniref:hypothetical protein n=1 Tax=unclassified Actinoplanes TaxID=2626549 RepID=UPI00342063B6